jgi:hypothetical protein
MIHPLHLPWQDSYYEGAIEVKDNPYAQSVVIFVAQTVTEEPVEYFKLPMQ